MPIERRLLATYVLGAAVLSLALFGLVISPLPANASATVPLCQGQPATIVGTPGNDALVGTPGPDVIVALGGNDRIFGRAGADIICGGEGNDVIRGGFGPDSILGQGGDDVIRGGNGNDFIAGNLGHDDIRGDAHSDVLEGGYGNDFLRGGNARDEVFGADGQDRLWGGNGDDLLIGGAGVDFIVGHRGHDEIWGDDAAVVLATADTIQPGFGIDIVNGTEEAAAPKLVVDPDPVPPPVQLQEDPPAPTTTTAAPTTTTTTTTAPTGDPMACTQQRLTDVTDPIWAGLEGNASDIDRHLAIVNRVREVCGQQPLAAGWLDSANPLVLDYAGTLADNFALCTEQHGWNDCASNASARGWWRHSQPGESEYFGNAQVPGRGWVGENIAFRTQGSAEGLLRGWILSTGHFCSMISPNFDQLGVSVAVEQGITFGSHVFRGPGSSGGDVHAVCAG